MSNTFYDVCIAGAGPAGLSAALILARCRRRIIVFDDQKPRNYAAQHIHGFLTQDGITPESFRRQALADLKAYAVEPRYAHIESVERTPISTFRVLLGSGESIISRKLILATGVRDQLPIIEGFQTYYGKGVHHCPYCDAYEYSGQTFVAFGTPGQAVGLAHCLRTWSCQIVACSNGESFSEKQLIQMGRLGIRTNDEQVTRLEGTDRLQRIRFISNNTLECAAVFFNTSQYQRSSLGFTLGCYEDEEGHLENDKKQRTPVAGVCVAGDADGDVQFVIVAAAEGAKAAVSINRQLQDEEIYPT